MPSISSISIVIKAITSPFIKGIRGAASVVGRFGSMLASLSGILIKLATVGIAALSASLVALTVKVIQTASKFETLQSQFITLLGGATEARKRFQELKKFAAETPFQVEEIAKASRVLQSLTGGLLATGDGLRLVGDAAAIANEKFSLLAIHIGRLFQGLTTGRAVGESLARLQELGLLSGEARTKIEDLQKAGEKGAKVWNIVKEALEKNKGAMKILSETAAGLFSTVKDNLNIAFAELGALLLPLVKVLLKEAITRFTNLQQWIVKNKDALQDLLMGALSKLVPIFLQIGNVGAAVFQVLTQVFAIDGPLAVDKMLDAIQVFLVQTEFAIKNFPEFWAVMWEKIKLNTIATMADLFAIILTPFKLITINIVEIFKFAFNLVVSAAKLMGEEIGIALKRAVTLDKGKLKELDIQLADLLKRKDLKGAQLLAGFNFVDVTGLEDFEREVLKTSNTIREAFGVGDKEFKKLAKRSAALQEKMAAFQKARIAGNEQAAANFLAQIQALIDKGKLADDLIDSQKKGIEDVSKAIKDISEPTLAEKGTQAAARGELGLVGQGREMIKLAKQQLRQLTDINKNIGLGGIVDANFGFGGA